MNAYQRGEMFHESHVCRVVLISLNNSWFTPGNLADAFHKASLLGGKVVALMADMPAVWNYMAISKAGVEKRMLIRSWSRQRANTKKRLVKAISLSGVEVHTVSWKSAYRCPKFRELRASLSKNLMGSKALQDRVWEVAQEPVRRLQQYLISDLPWSSPNEEMKRCAANFFLEEAAYLCSASEILNLRKVVFEYHRRMDLLSSALDGRFGNSIVENVGLSLV